MHLVTLRAVFDDMAMADRVRRQLVERDYEAMLVARRSGGQFLIVRTAAYFAPEVEGLVWLAGGSMS